MRAVVAFRVSSCKRVDIKQLITFSDEWLAELEQRRDRDAPRDGARFLPIGSVKS